MPQREWRQIIAQGLKSLCENLKLAQFCSAHLSSGHWGRGDTKHARLKGGRYKTMPILSSHTDSSALKFQGLKSLMGRRFSSGLPFLCQGEKSRPPTYSHYVNVLQVRIAIKIPPSWCRGSNSVE